MGIDDLVIIMIVLEVIDRQVFDAHPRSLARSLGALSARN